MNHKIVSIFLIFLFFFCQKKTEQPEKVIDRDMFVQVYCDVVSINDQLPPGPKMAVVDSILAFHHVTPEEFENTIQAYNKNPKRWKKVFEQIVAELEKRLEKLDNPTETDSSKIKTD